MLKKKVAGFVFICFLLLFDSYAFPQGGASLFLTISPTPRITGMGETGTGVADDASAVFLNPAGLGFQKGFELNSDYSNWFKKDKLLSGDGLYNFFAKKYFENIGTFSASYSYMQLDNGFIGSSFYLYTVKQNDYAFSVGYANSFWESLAFGLNIKYIHSQGKYSSIPVDEMSNYEVEGSSLAFDLGVLYKPQKFVIPFINFDLGNRFGIGLNLANMGQKMAYYNSVFKEPLPTNLRLGIGVDVYKTEDSKLVLAFDFNRMLIHYNGNDYDEFYKAIFTAWEDAGLKRADLSTGFEYSYCDPDFMIFGNPIKTALRGGYFGEPENYGNRKYITLGGGIKYSIVSFDFSWLSTVEQDSPLKNVYKYSLSINI